VGKSGVLEHKSGNISETRKARGKVTMEDLQELTDALWNGTIQTLYGLLFPKLWGSQIAIPTQNVNRYYLANG